MRLSIMAEDTILHLQCEIAIFDRIEKVDALHIVHEPPQAMLPAKLIQERLPEVPIGDVPDIMPKGNRLDQIFVQAQASPNCPGNLGDQLHMQHPVRNVVVLHQVKDLCLVNVS